MFNIQYDFTAPPGGSYPSDVGAIMALAGILIVVGLIALVVLYIYGSLTLMMTAKKTKTDPAVLAWVPVGNMYLMSKMAKMAWWPILLLPAYLVLSVLSMIPYIGILFSIIGFIVMIALCVFVYIWTWKICEARGRPGWWSLLGLVPFVGIIWYFIMWGILAWGK